MYLLTHSVKVQDNNNIGQKGKWCPWFLGYQFREILIKVKYLSRVQQTLE